jgi:predicted HAD superfamily Cof-like phosphohydrolase
MLYFLYIEAKQKSNRSIMTNFEKVGLFMKTFGQEVKITSSLSSEKINNLRISLINEELEEFKEAVKNNDLKEAVDALTDILYVTYGAGHAFGVNLDKCFDEVQKSNMSKLGNDGKPIYNENGKVMKGPNYFKPDLSKFIV